MERKCLKCGYPIPEGSTSCTKCQSHELEKKDFVVSSKPHDSKEPQY